MSSFRITAVPRVRYNGQWRNLTQQDSDGYWLVPNEGTSNDDHDNVKVKFFYGSMNQQAEPTLVRQARPASRWTTKHRGAGIAYAVVFSELRKKGDGLASPAKLFFEVKGAPLYDWRKDSTVGGSGPHRWEDQSTWEYSDNPVVQLYNLERGFFNGTQRMVGKAVRASRLPLAEYTQAANICDEGTPDGSRRYRAHAIAKDGPGANHDANITPILEAMCGSWVERVDGEFPIAGAPQAIVATLTDDDFKVGAPLRITAKRRRTELVNTVAASYVSAADFYETKDAATRIDKTALAEDQETLASSIPFSAVTDVRQVDRLADIAIRGARYQASAEGTVHPKFLDKIKEGRWITWASAKYGTRTFQVLSRQLGGHNTDSVRDLTLHLQQVSNGVFDPTAYETTPPEIIIIQPPEWLAQVQNFLVIPNLVQADGAGTLPGARVVWDRIDDISVVGVDVEYWPLNDPTQVFRKYVSSDINVDQISEGLTSLTEWAIRTRLRVDNGRAVAWSVPVKFTTMDARSKQNPVDYEGLDNDLKGGINFIFDQSRELLRQAQELATVATGNNNSNYLRMESIKRQISSTYGTAKSEWREEIYVATGPNSSVGQQLVQINVSLGDKADASTVSLLQSRVDGVGQDITAISNALLQVNASVDGDVANGAFRMEAQAGSGGTSMRIAAFARVGTTGGWKEAGYSILVTPTKSSFLVSADQFAVADPSIPDNVTFPFVVQNGQVVIQNARLGILYFDELHANNDKLIIRGGGDNADFRLFS